MSAYEPKGDGTPESPWKLKTPSLSAARAEIGGGHHCCQMAAGGMSGDMNPC